MENKTIQKPQEPKPDSNWPIIELDPDLSVYEVNDDLQRILDKVDTEDITEVSSREATLWKQHFAYVISNQFTLTTAQLLNTHNRWLTDIEYHSGISDERFKAFEDKVASHDANEWELTDFLNFVVNYFTLEELSAVDINNTA